MRCLVSRKNDSDSWCRMQPFIPHKYHLKSGNTRITNRWYKKYVGTHNQVTTTAKSCSSSHHQRELCIIISKIHPILQLSSYQDLPGTRRHSDCICYRSGIHPRSLLHQGSPSSCGFSLCYSGSSDPLQNLQAATYYLMRGIKRVQGGKKKKRKRAPITPSMLKTININLFNSSHVYEDKVMLWAALLTAFYGFLRVSEYTSDRKKTFDPTTTLLFSDMHFTSDGSVTILLKASKTDPFRDGVMLRIAPNGSSLCPVQALRHFYYCHPSKTGPLFTFQNGRFLSRSDVNSLLVSTTDGVANISSHSLRIGAASTAAAAGCPKWLIQALGRWSSDCFRAYIRIPRKTIKNTSKILASCNETNIERFDPDTLFPWFPD